MDSQEIGEGTPGVKTRYQLEEYTAVRGQATVSEKHFSSIFRFEV
jgi:hypothetical protein